MFAFVETYTVPRDQKQDYPGFLVIRLGKEITVSLSIDYSPGLFCWECGQQLEMPPLDGRQYQCSTCKTLLILDKQNTH